MYVSVSGILAMENPHVKYNSNSNNYNIFYDIAGKWWWTEIAGLIVSQF